MPCLGKGYQSDSESKPKGMLEVRSEQNVFGTVWEVVRWDGNGDYSIILRTSEEEIAKLVLACMNW